MEELVVEMLRRELFQGRSATDVTLDTWNTETRDLVRKAVDRVVVHEHAIEIVLKAEVRGTTAIPVDGEDDGGGRTILKASLPAPRPRQRREILVPGGVGTEPRRLDQALILALARARSWMRALRHCEYANTAAIARRFDLSDAHVRRLLRFAYLAPDIVEAIVEGHQPRSLTVKLLLRGIPLAWSDQRAAFGQRARTP